MMAVSRHVPSSWTTIPAAVLGGMVAGIADVDSVLGIVVEGQSCLYMHRMSKRGFATVLQIASKDPFKGVTLSNPFESL